MYVGIFNLLIVVCRKSWAYFVILVIFQNLPTIYWTQTCHIQNYEIKYLKLLERFIINTQLLKV